MKLKHYLLSMMLLLGIFGVFAQNVAPFNPVYNNTLKGDVLLIGNNNLSRHVSNPYTGNGDNHSGTAQVNVDIDGDPSTVNSSSCNLAVPTLSRPCYKVVYAALYWSATYEGSNRANINRVKLKIPGSAAYQTVTGTVIYDEGTSNLLSANNHVPYAAFANVTSLLNATSAEGVYTVADIVATIGNNSPGYSGGWHLFVVYEDPRLPAKNITTLNGFTGINGSTTQTVSVAGFTANPFGPVNAKVAFGVLEGDKSITGDRMFIRGVNTNPGFTQVTHPSRPNDNAFNSTYTDTAGLLPGRTPNSTNTLGYDAGVTLVPNPGNSVLGNGETQAEIRLNTGGDVYNLFFLAFSIEVIEPDIAMVKSVENLAGQPVDNQSVTLCQELNYVISFDNIGNDDAQGIGTQPAPYGTNYVYIRDVLPINTSLLGIDTSNVPGTIVVNSPPGTLNIYVPKQYLTVNETRHEVILHVRLACTCAELTTACSNLIQNQAFITYEGVLNGNDITNDPSFSDFDANCLRGTPTTTNFLADMGLCSFNTDVFICGTGVTLTAGAGFDNYLWTGPAGATFTPNNTSQVVTVNMPGVYTVNGTDAVCRPLTQTFNVIQYGSGLTNPIIPYDESLVPVICADNGERLPYIFLCGAGDSQLLQTNITNTTSIEWFMYNPALAGCGPYPATNCPVTNNACWTNMVGTGANYTVTQAGFYRVVFTFPGGCNRTFYFNAYQNLLDPQAVAQNIICGKPGSITVNNVPSSGYQFQLLNSSNVVVFGWQSSNVFTPINTAGTYTVQVQPTTFSGGCIFTIPNIGIQVQNATVTAQLTQPLCFGEFGSVNLGITGVPGQYYYVLHQGPTVASPIVGTAGPTNTGFNVFPNLTPGQTYTWEVYTDPTTPTRTCYTTGTFTINNPSQLVVTSSITVPLTTCTDGEITVNVSGGVPPYYYYVNSAPPAPFSSSNVIPVTTPGTYVITVYDSVNCHASTQQTLNLIPAPVFTVSHTDISCASSPNAGSITFNVTNANGNTILYSINGGGNWSTSPVFTNLPAGTYNTQIQYTVGTAVCTSTIQPITIVGATPIAATAAITTPYTCTGGTGTVGNAVITVTPTSSGAGGLQYSNNGGSTWQASPIFSNLGAGTYTILVRDANGCTITLPAIIITPLTPPTDLNFSATALSCPTNVSTVIVTAVGGAAPLTYAITSPISVNNGTSNVFSNLAPNTYTFQVTDSRNCAYSETYTINPLAPVTVTPVVVNNVICFGTATGVIRFTVTGATNYTYTVSGPSGYSQSGAGVGTTPITLPAGPAGAYTINVINTATNCPATATINILGPPAALAATLNTTPVTCNTLGTITVNASGGWGGYTYSISPSVGSLSGNVFSNVPAGGPYTITTTDSSGCTTTNTVSFVAPTNPTLVLSPTSDFCFDNGNQATLVVTAAGGQAPYSFSINGQPYVPGNTPPSSHTFNNLTPGSYTISVRDAYGCTNVAPFSQTINPQLTVNTVLTKTFDCTATPNAIISGTISGGYPGYTYAVSYNGNPVYTPLGAVTGSTFTYSIPTANPGTYTFQITDTRGCTAISNVVTVAPLSMPVLTVATLVPAVLCHGDATGAITWSVLGGTPPYTINIVNTTTSTPYGSQLTGLPAGNYTFTLTDSKSCTDTKNFTITEPAQIVYTENIVPIQCNAVGGYTLGQICVSAITGGTAPFTYTLVDLTGGGAPQNFVSPTGTAHCFTGIDFGVYDLQVTDLNGCTVVHSNLVMSNPPNDLIFTITPTIPSCAAGATVQVDLSGALGAGPYEFGIMNCTPAAGYVCAPNAWNAPSNPPFTHIFTGLTPGVIYTFVVRDLSTGCYYFETMTAPTPTNSTIVPTLVPNNVTCRNANDGSVSGSLAGVGVGCTSVSYVIQYSPSGLPVVPAVSGTIAGPPFNFTNLGLLPPGNYMIYFSEVNGPNAGCGVTSNSFTISQSATDLTLTASATPDNCNVNAGVITATPNGGTGPYTYQYLPCGTLPAPIATSPGWIASNSFNAESGCYDVYVKDAYNCIRTVPVTITLDPTPVVAASLANACVPEGNFVINVTLPTAGVAPHTFSIDGGAFQTFVAPFSLPSLSSGNHTIQVRDRNGCGNTVSVNILAPMIGSAAFTTQPTCNTATGTITTTVTGGSGNYSFNLPPTTNATGIFTNIPPGTHSVTITDTTTGCTTNAVVTLAAADIVNFTLAQTPVKCAGDSNGSITVTLGANNDDVPYTYALIAPSPVIVAPQTSNVFNNLPTGNYTVEVVSSRGCRHTETITVGTPLALTGTATLPTPLYTCTGNVVNSVVVTINETAGTGTAPYTYSINGGGYFSTNIFNVVASTTATTNFTFNIKDFNGCIFNGNGVIPQIIPLNATVTQTQQINCINTGEIVTINASGGLGAYTYVSLPTPGGAANVTQTGANQFTISAPGTYYFRVIDSVTGCWFDTAAYLVPVFNTIDVTATATGVVTCFGGNNGTLNFSVTGYTGAFTYDVLDAANVSVANGGGIAPVVNVPVGGLPVGTYTVQVRETAHPFCIEVSNQITILGPSAALTLNASETANVTCNNNAGIITAIASGGWGTYTYSINPNIGTQTSPGVFTGLSGTTPYIITVTDAQGCPQTANVTLTRPNPITLAAAIPNVQLTCFGVNDGSITVTGVTGGQNVLANYTYTLNYVAPAGPSSGPQPSPTFSNLAPGDYSITINDPYNCTFTSNVFTVLPANQLFATLTKVANSQVCDTSFETLTLSASGGNGSYEYSTSASGPWTAFGSPLNLGSLAPGTYTYYVRDTNHCAAVTSNSVAINVVPALTLTVNPVPMLNCSGDLATITAFATGGEGNYIYSIIPAIQPSNTTGVFNNIPVGPYTIAVDSGDCTRVTQPVSVTAPLPFDFDAVAVGTTCSYLDDGKIVITVTGDDGRIIQYDLVHVAPSATATHPDHFAIQIPNPSTPFTIQDLSPGDYLIRVYTQTGCTGSPTEIPLTITRATPLLTPTMTPVNETCFGNNDGTITVTNISGGTTVDSLGNPVPNPYQITLNYLLEEVVPATVPPTYVDNSVYIPLNNAAGLNTHEFTNLAPGTYNVNVTDVNGCDNPVAVIVGPGDNFDPIVNVTYPCNPLTNTPMVRIEVENTLDPNGNFGAGYSFQLDGFASQSSPIFESTNPVYTVALSTTNTHTVFVLGPNNCPKNAIPDPFTVTPLNVLDVQLVQNGLNTVQALTTGGSGGYQYVFYADGNIVQSGSSDTYTYFQQYNEIRVEVTDSSGCTDFDFDKFPYVPIFIDNVFTPNGDGSNDGWAPHNISNYKNAKTRIYDRYGRMVKELGVNDKWDGKYEGKELPSGDYWYVLKLDGNDGEEYMGHFTLYR